MGQLSGFAAIVRGGMAQGNEPDEMPTAKQPEQKAKPDKNSRAAKANTKPASPPIKKVSKSQDPDWKAYSLFLKKETHSEMNFLLRKLDDGEDMSDLVQRLVEKWVASNR